MRGSQRSAPAAPGNLPLELDAFVGRSAELTRLTEALETARLVTVTGMGGMGKSRLAAHAAARTDSRDGAWHVELSAGFPRKSENPSSPPPRRAGRRRADAQVVLRPLEDQRA